jgi:UDP-galactopyranose mutase
MEYCKASPLEEGRILQGMDFVVFSHLRWGFVYQRPQHLLGRCARSGNRVFFIEEPLVEQIGEPGLRISQSAEQVTVVTPVLPATPDRPPDEAMRALIENLLKEQQVVDPVLWYYNPMALNFTRDLPASLIVYDCMDELSAFRGAPPGLRAAEESLLRRADLVFTGGKSLHEAKRRSHPSVHLFPSSIDVLHFQQARLPQPEPDDQAPIGAPRLGYCGVIDERMDLPLLSEVSDLRPTWQFVLLGPVVKIDPSDLPRRPNIHYLGMKAYNELPAYLAGWNIGMLPFARNESTRYISPTKTPEYLAVGLPTISTPIHDVVSPYGDLGLVRIADDAQSFVSAAEDLMRRSESEACSWLAQVDSFLSALSWDRTWNGMWELIHNTTRDPTEVAMAAD